MARRLVGPLVVATALGIGLSPPAAAAEPQKPAKAPAATSKATPVAKTPPQKDPPGAIPEAPDPRRGQGSRKIEPKKASAPEAAPAPPQVPAASLRRGKPPAKPSPSLPPGASRPTDDRVTRRQIAAGLTNDDLLAGKDDPELKKLREAERVLFPEPLPGMTAGWSWDLPRPGARGPEVSSTGLPPDPAERAGATPSAKDSEWLGGLSLPNLPLRYDERVVKYLRFYRDSPSGRAVARVWAKKCGRYRAALQAELAKAGLPTDLVWLSLIESSHNPTIVSPAGAAGLWQFMPETARTYGLTVDRWVDERLDPERSTEAATRFLADLYRRFGSWDLAMAAYNMGHGGLVRSIKKFNTNDFWELGRHEAGIPWETSLYVPKILATAIAMNNKKSFGLDDVAPDPPEAFDVVRVGPGVALDDVARTAGVDPAAVERLNPAFLSGRTPPAAPGRASPNYTVRLPRASASAARTLSGLERSREELVSFVVRQGDTPASIARTTRTSEAAIRSANRIGPQEVLSAGTVVLVPKAQPIVAPVGPVDDVVVVTRDVAAPPDAVRIFYPVVPGDTLSGVAGSFGVTRADLAAWNAIDESARLQEGMVLQVLPKASRSLAGIRTFRERDVRVLVAGSPEFIDYFEGLNGKRRVVVTVKAGDTLASIGRRYDTTVGWMERINRRSRSDRLSAGEPVVVYVDRKRFPESKVTAAAAPPAPEVPSLSELGFGAVGITQDSAPSGPVDN
ncbi:MAG TPA: transglycosylase SLT domain-containing protein [Polyangiaceae bacterium]|nr:transglycosylase SLT domain-containing protein [Polyangiaceae bacterium]